MSAYMNRLSSIFLLAKSKKVTEYKKAIKLLLEFWDDDSETTEKLITDYSLNPSEKEDDYTWNDIYSVVHELFVNEIDRTSKLGGNSGKADKERVIKLIYITSDKAKYCIKPKNVILSVIQILQIQSAHIYAEFFEIYMGILRKNVLLHRSQRILIQPNHWQELLNSCITILNDVVPGVDYVKLLETLELIVRYGCSLSNLLFETRQILPILGNLMEKYENYNIKSSDILFKVTYTVCQQIATDSRYILCKFSENLPLSLISHKGSEEKYQLYLLFVQVHHPNGEIIGGDLSHTYDEDKWKAILNLIYKMILNDVKPVKLSNNFINLACEVFRQKKFLKTPNSLPLNMNESLYLQPRKKRRVLGDSEKLIDFINDRDPERAWPMIQIATSLYDKYPDCLELHEYIEFLEVVIKLMGQAYKNFDIMEDLCDLALTFIKNEKLYKSDELKIQWDKIWDVVIRFLSMAHKEKLNKSCKLVQKLFTCERVSNPNLLLKLYLSKSIQQTNLTVQTLNIYCENIILLNDSKDCDINLSSEPNSLKLQLMQWCLSSFNNQPIGDLDIKTISKMMIGFTLKSWYKINHNLEENKCYINSPNDIFSYKKTVDIKDIERCYLSLKLKSNLPFNTISESFIHDLSSKEIDLNNPYNSEDVVFLVNNLLEFVQTDDDVYKDLASVISKSALMAKIITDLKTLSMIPCSFDEFCLVTELQTCLNKIFDQLCNINWSKSVKNTLEVTKSLILLFQTKYDPIINDIILNMITISVIKKIYEISKIEKDEFREYDPKIFQCKTNSLIILALYCCMNGESEMSESQIKIASTLLKLKKYSLRCKYDIISVFTMLEIFANISDKMITEEFIELLMSFLMDMFQEWQKDDDVACKLLELLPKFLDIASNLEESHHVHNLLLFCKLYHDRFVKGAFGQLTHLSMVQCLNNIVKHNAFCSSEIEILNHNVFTTFINSPYYIVRLETLHYIHSIFSIEKVDYIWKSNFFDELKGAVSKIFLLQRQLSDDEIQEERLLRSVSALQILSTVVCSKSVFHCSALFTLLHVAVDKNIDVQIVEDILKIINDFYKSSKGIIEENLNYLLTIWSDLKNLDSFPFVYLGCLDLEDFYSRYYQFIFPIYVRTEKMNEARNLCKHLDKPFQTIFKQCSANIIPWALADGNILKKLSENNDGFEESGNLSALIKDNLRHIIIETVQRLHDLNHFYATFDETVNLPSSNPPHFKSETLDICFNNLINTVLGEETKQTVFFFMITRKPFIVQKALLQLTCNIYSTKITEYQAKALHQFAYFCSKIIEELKHDYCDSVSLFFIKDIGCTLLNLISKDNLLITKLACKFLFTFFSSLLPLRNKQIGNILSQCVKTLTPLVFPKKKIAVAEKILVFLLKDQRDCLNNFIEKLGCLPTIFKSETDGESQVLENTLEHFLQTSDDNTCSIDSLSNLQKRLISEKAQLEKLYKELELNQGFAEHCAASVLHRLVYRLICLTKSNDTKISLQAAKCLGILGPADLTTLILHPQDIQRRESVDKADMLTYKIYKILMDLYVSDNIELKQLSSDALYGIVNSPWGSRLGKETNIGEDFESLGKFLQIFKTTNKSNTTKGNLQVNIENFEEIFNKVNILWSKKSEDSYTSWISELSSSVANCLSGFYSASLTPIFQHSVPFCEATLPRIVSLIIQTDSGCAKKICDCINRFFEYHFNHSGEEKFSKGFSTLSMEKHAARDAVQCMLKVVNHLRIQTREQVHLNFEYLPIAMATQYCSAYFSSVLYIELWCLSNLKEIRYFDSIPIIDQIYEQNNDLGKVAQDLLREAYIKIGDSDSLHGCGSSHLQNRKSRIPYYSNFQKLDKLILSHDIELSAGFSSARGMIKALRDSSLHYLASNFFNQTPMEVDSMNDMNFDSLWRLSDWSQITNLKTSNFKKKSIDFSLYHYEALKSLHENDKSSLKNHLEQAYFCIIKNLKEISLESCKAVYPQLSRLQMLREIEEFAFVNPDDFSLTLSNWDNEKYICNNNFRYVEPILSQRAVMFGIQDDIKNNRVIKKALVDTQIKISEIGREQGHLSVAARALESLSKTLDLSEETRNNLLYHEACLAWMRNDEEMARFNLRSLIKKENSINKSLLARALRVYGNMIEEKKSENPVAIINKYYRKALDTYLSMENLENDDILDGCKARATLAKFAHEQYLLITDYMKSPQFESLQECINYSKNTVIKNRNNDQDVRRYMTLTHRQSDNDCLELNNIKKDRLHYLLLAITNYMATLQDSDNHDLLIFRLVSLWLDNTHVEGVNQILENQLQDIPSYKFIPLLPQLAPHISNVKDEFTQKIEQLLERCALEHPHHTLPILLALKNLYNDSKYCGKKVTHLEPRVLGTQNLIQKLLSTGIRPIVQEMDRLSDALVSLAYYDLDKKQGQTISTSSIPRSESLSQIKDFVYSMVPTLTIKINKNGNYSNIIAVSKYDSTFGNVGGINAPKKIICTGTDGIRRPQLVKGKDDLRQDAVMQQVFVVMNSLLKSNKDAKQRKLYIRTYKVVPLTQRSGVLEWCENTLPLSNILTGDGSRHNPGLHKKYYPNDYATGDCRKRLSNGKTPKQRYDIFIDCCKNLHPAFHHFFTENYLSPETWFERRLAYTRSVATTSMIGYILGLGDRHVSNILIDKTTAEVVHIDFGIAFEQGKVLPTPETVPFRLTRDIEIAMGVSGVEGTMRRSCEETITVLREQKEIIVTLLRVLLYDPLYSWAITPAKAATYQSERSKRDKESNSPEGTTETNKLAERALVRVQQKLQGIEEGVASSVAGQVERLIQQARDPSNLCKLYEGWQAYL